MWFWTLINSNNQNRIFLFTSHYVTNIRNHNTTKLFWNSVIQKPLVILQITIFPYKCLSKQWLGKIGPLGTNEFCNISVIVIIAAPHIITLVTVLQSMFSRLFYYFGFPEESFNAFPEDLSHIPVVFSNIGHILYNGGGYVTI